MQRPWDSDSIIWLSTILFTGRQCICTAMKNITIIKAAAAAGPEVNAYFDLHLVK